MTQLFQLLGPQASWLVEKFIELAEKYHFKVYISKPNYFTNIKNVEDKYDLKGVLISCRGAFEYHRKMIKNRINFLCNQLSSLNNFLPIRYMTQFWNSFIKLHLDCEAPLMRYFSVAHLTKWQKLDIQSIKITLRLPQCLSNEVIDKLWKQFGFRINAILKSTSEQLLRHRQEQKRSNEPLTKIQQIKNIFDFKHQEMAQGIKVVKLKVLIIE